MPGAVSAFLWTPALGVAACVWAAEVVRTDLTATCSVTPARGCGTPSCYCGFCTWLSFSWQAQAQGVGSEAVLALPHSQEAAGALQVGQGAV